MTNITLLLEQEGYYKVSFKIRKSNHLFVNAKINGVKGLFLIDTGASNTCIDLEMQNHFKMQTVAHHAKASGAGANGLYTEISKNNTLQFNTWKTKSNAIILLDLSHVNTALTEYKLPKVQGIIGSDLLKKHEAIINYSLCTLFIR